MSVELSNSNNNSSIQYLSLDEYMKKEIKEIQELFENEYGIKYSPGTNFIMTSFNTDTQERIIHFDGALPLHDFVYCINDFFNDFLLENNTTKIYILSIIKETQYVNLCSINGAETENERKIALKEMAKTMINIIDRTYGLYINEHHKKKLAYRNDTTFKALDSSFNYYIKNVRTLLQSYQ
jgi:hypothetical protein